LVTSSFAHKDVDHLLRNLTAILVTMPIIERLMKQKEAVLFLSLASIFSSLISIQLSGEPSIGASGMVYGMDGYLMKIYGMDAEWIPYVLEQALFAIANNDAGIDHWAHFGGFVFGFIYKDLPVYI
jgi:membrane associated rhomboid family serine protease